MSWGYAGNTSFAIRFFPRENIWDVICAVSAKSDLDGPKLESPRISHIKSTAMNKVARLNTAAGSDESRQARSRSAACYHITLDALK
jgi:hypothetical protein